MRLPFGLVEHLPVSISPPPFSTFLNCVCPYVCEFVFPLCSCVYVRAVHMLISVISLCFVCMYMYTPPGCLQRSYVPPSSASCCLQASVLLHTVIRIYVSLILLCICPSAWNKQISSSSLASPLGRQANSPVQGLPDNFSMVTIAESPLKSPPKKDKKNKTRDRFTTTKVRESN